MGTTTLTLTKAGGFGRQKLLPSWCREMGKNGGGGKRVGNEEDFKEGISLALTLGKVIRIWTQRDTRGI